MSKIDEKIVAPLAVVECVGSCPHEERQPISQEHEEKGENPLQRSFKHSAPQSALLTCLLRWCHFQNLKHWSISNRDEYYPAVLDEARKARSAHRLPPILAARKLSQHDVRGGCPIPDFSPFHVHSAGRASGPPGCSHSFNIRAVVSGHRFRTMKTLLGSCHRCPRCSAPLELMESSMGFYLTCPNYPFCQRYAAELQKLPQPRL
jgi:hypothetical protein